MHPEEMLGYLEQARDDLYRAKDGFAGIIKYLEETQQRAGVAGELAQNVLDIIRGVDPNGTWEETQAIHRFLDFCRNQADLINESTNTTPARESITAIDGAIEAVEERIARLV